MGTNRIQTDWELAYAPARGQVQPTIPSPPLPIPNHEQDVQGFDFTVSRTDANDIFHRVGWQLALLDAAGLLGCRPYRQNLLKTKFP